MTMNTAIHALVMPTWGLSMQEGRLVNWLLPEGTAVTPDTELAEIETSKLTNVLEAGHSGILRRRLLVEGEARGCGALIGIIADADTNEAAIDTFIAEFAPVGDDISSDSAAAPEPAMTPLPDGRLLRGLVRGEEGGATPVVLVHGFGGDLEGWQDLQPRLAHGRRAWAFDLPGHGESDKTLHSGSLDELAGMLLAGLDANGIDRLHLVGHSLGGAVSLRLAALVPERIASLSLLAPAAFGGGIDHRYVDDFLAARRVRDVQKVLERLFADPALASRAMAEGVVRIRRLDGAQEALEQIAAACLGAGAADLRKIAADCATRHPVCVIRGEADAIIAAAPVPDGVTLHLFPDVGHMPHIEAPSAVFDLLSRQVGVA